MTFNPIQFPLDPLFIDPSFTDTGLNQIQVHQLRARFYSNQFPLPRELSNWRITPNERFATAALIQLRREAFPHWAPNAFQLDILRTSRAYLSVVPRCHICGLIKGLYCETPTVQRIVPNQSTNTFQRDRDQDLIDLLEPIVNSPARQGTQVHSTSPPRPPRGPRLRRRRVQSESLRSHRQSPTGNN